MKKAYLTLDFRCNNDCLLCANTPQERREDKILTAKDVYEFLGRTKMGRGDSIEISGGEPTLRKDIVDIFKFYRDNSDAELVLLSNARKLSEGKLSNQLSGYTDRIATAIYNTNPQMHDFVTQRNKSFSQTLKGLKNMDDNGTKISVKMIPIKQNYKELPEFVDFAFKNFSDPTVFFSGLDLKGHAEINRDKLSVSYSEIMPYLEKALDKAEDYGKHVLVFTMPMCSIDPHYWKYYSIGMDEISKEIEFMVPGVPKDKESLFLGRPTEGCKECALEPRCYWPWQGYIETFGDKEIKPIN